MATRERPRTPATPAPKNIAGAERRRGVTVTHKEGQEIVSQTADVQSTRKMVPAIHSKVGVSGSVTTNMGDFNSVRVEVWVEIPCIPTKEKRREAYLEASDEVEEYVQRENDLAQGIDPDAADD